MSRVFAVGIALSLAAVLLLAASCGGSSGSPVDPGGGGSSKWNDMTWNKDNWGP